MTVEQLEEETQAGKSEFIKQASIQLLSAYLIEDRIAWYKDMECFGTFTEDLVKSSVEAAECLWDELDKKGYV